jgi:hypothetical protein
VCGGDDGLLRGGEDGGGVFGGVVLDEPDWSPPEPMSIDGWPKSCWGMSCVATSMKSCQIVAESAPP